MPDGAEESGRYFVPISPPVEEIAKRSSDLDVPKKHVEASLAFSKAVDEGLEWDLSTPIEGITNK